MSRAKCLALASAALSLAYLAAVPAALVLLFFDWRVALLALAVGGVCAPLALATSRVTTSPRGRPPPAGPPRPAAPRRTSRG